MPHGPAQVVIIAGPNGAGKSTAAPELLQGALGVDHFIDGDQIALGLSVFDPQSVARNAGRIMFRRMRARRWRAYQSSVRRARRNERDRADGIG